MYLNLLKIGPEGRQDTNNLPGLCGSVFHALFYDRVVVSHELAVRIICSLHTTMRVMCPKCRAGSLYCRYYRGVVRGRWLNERNGDTNHLR